MSWNRKELRDFYSRAHSKFALRKEQADNDKVDHWDEMMSSEYYADEMYPTLKEVAVGKLLTMLTNLKIPYAEERLREWYW